MILKNDLLLRTLKGEKTERTPVWVMRQAGRILPEYREIRSKLRGFKELVETPELAAEVTIQPVDILGVDAAIIFSDILVIPEAMGLPYQMVKGEGPWFDNTIETENDVAKLKIAEPEEDLNYVIEAIKITKSELNGRVPIIGFAGAPWTVFCYMIEGHGSKTFSKARRMLYENPDLSHRLLDMITESTICYLNAQAEAGANAVQLFDSWASVLGPEQYNEFSLKYLGKICDSVKAVPKIVFPKGAWYSYQELGKLNCQAIGIDWNTSPTTAREAIGNVKVLQGNLDPCLLYAPEKIVISETKRMLTEFGNTKHIANLGHGVYPDTDFNKVKLFIDTIKEHKF